jgi:hypothetical protein
MTEPDANWAMTTAKSPDFESGVPLIVVTTSHPLAKQLEQQS